MKGGGQGCTCLCAMKKEDFHVGQKVWVYLTNNAARWIKPEERIQEWEVVSVGRKYITVARNRGGSEVRFNADEGFLQENPGGGIGYVLFLTEADLRRELWREELRNEMLSGYHEVLTRLSDQDLQAVSDIFRKYR